MADQEKEILEQECCEADQECAADSAEAKETACEGTCEQDCEETAECEGVGKGAHGEEKKLTREELVTITLDDIEAAKHMRDDAE